MSANCTLSYMTVHHWNGFFHPFSYRRTYAYSLGIWGCHLPKFPVDQSDFGLPIAISTARPAKWICNTKYLLCVQTWHHHLGLIRFLRGRFFQIDISLYLWERRQDKDLRLAFEEVVRLVMVFILLKDLIFFHFHLKILIFFFFNGGPFLLSESPCLSEELYCSLGKELHCSRDQRPHLWGLDSNSQLLGSELHAQTHLKAMLHW